MLRDGAFVQAYNGQIAVDDAHQIIVAAALSNQGPDAQYFEPMLRRVVENCQSAPDTVTADSGYFSVNNVRSADHLGSEAFIAVGAHRNDGSPDDATTTAPKPTHQRACSDAHSPRDSARSSGVRASQGDRGTVFRPDPRGPRISPAIPAWPRKS